MRSIALMCAAALASGPVPVLADEVDALRERFEDETVSFAGWGFTPGKQREGMLGQGREHVFELDLAEGTEVAVVGIPARGRLHLILLGPDGSEVASDLRNNEGAVLSAKQTSGGTHSLKLVMAACEPEPCDYIVQFFAKNSELIRKLHAKQS